MAKSSRKREKVLSCFDYKSGVSWCIRFICISILPLKIHGKSGLLPRKYFRNRIPAATGYGPPREAISRGQMGRNCKISNGFLPNGWSGW